MRETRSVPQFRPPENSTLRARRLRRNPTDAETRLWAILRENFPEARFRRQVPIRHYVVDFASHRAKLIVEADGGQHCAERDTPRTKEIESEGYSIIRFWNHDILGNSDGVAFVIAEALHDRSPPPQPSPIKGEGVREVGEHGWLA